MGTGTVGHTASCARPEHWGPCDGVLRRDLPPTAAEVAQRSQDAYDAVLERGGSVAEAEIAREVGF